jgi:hypothetical protein
MKKAERNISYTPVNIKVFDFRSRTEACPDCPRINTRHKELKRSVVDIDLERPTAVVFLYNTYICKNPNCQRKHYQIDNELVQKGGRYTNRAKEKATRSVTEDGVTIRAARTRVRRDFNINPANASISRWTELEASSLLTEKWFEEPCIQEFSGILCIDETYDKGLAMLVAVDPVGGEIVGYVVTEKNVDDKVVGEFLKALQNHGLDVHTAVTDGSKLYPNILKKVFGPGIRHQLCLFHLSKNILGDVYAAARSVVYKKAKTIQERREVLKEMHVLFCNPSNLLKRAGKTKRSKKRWARRHEELLKAVEEVLEKYPYLRVYSDFIQSYYWIWDAETEEETWRRRDELFKDYGFQKEPRLKRAMKRLENDEMFKQYLYSFQDSRIPRTNNASERENRKFRQQQKKRYRGLRYEKDRRGSIVINLAVGKENAA